VISVSWDVADGQLERVLSRSRPRPSVAREYTRPAGADAIPTRRHSNTIKKTAARIPQPTLSCLSLDVHRRENMNAVQARRCLPGKGERKRRGCARSRVRVHRFSLLLFRPPPLLADSILSLPPAIFAIALLEFPVSKP
jgi:hypothetical protein